MTRFAAVRLRNERHLPPRVSIGIERASLAFALALGLASAGLAGCSQPAAPAEPIRAVRTLTIGAQGGELIHEFAGQVQARLESRLSFRVPGKLVARQVNTGDHVVKGQALAQLDATDLRLSQDAARAALEAAQVNHDQNSADFKRYVDLRAQGFISAAELERRDAALKASRAQLDQARSQASVQANQAGYAVLTADADGVVTEIYADPGTVVGAGTPVLKLAHAGPRDIVFSVPEDQLMALRPLRGRAGALSVTLWSGGNPLPATVREIAGAADAVTRTFLVRAELPVGAAELGQTGTVRIAFAPSDATLRLPLTALMELKGQSAVWLVDRTTMTVRPQVVSVVRPDGDGLVIGGGLKAGDVVVTAGVHVLQTGQKVSFYNDAAAH